VRQVRAGADSNIVEAAGVNIKAIRGELGLSQAALARLVGVSVRAVQSCEQGWRRPGVLEKAALLLLMAHRRGGHIPSLRCWEVMSCPPERHTQCITYRSGQGHLCWFLSGTMCTGSEARDWDQKRGICMHCALFKLMLGQALGYAH
jgi:DNA-binding transcriptional regulator YiaG